MSLYSDDSSITINFNGHNLIFKKVDPDYYNPNKNKNLNFYQISNDTTEQINVDNTFIPDYEFDTYATNRNVYKDLSSCKLLILCLLTADSFFRVEHRSYAIDPNVFNSKESNLKNMSFNDLSKLSRGWINDNEELFKFPSTSLDFKNLQNDASLQSKMMMAANLANIVSVIQEKFDYVRTFRDLIKKILEECTGKTVTEGKTVTVLQLYVTDGSIVLYECFQEIQDGRTANNCYAVLARTIDIKYIPKNITYGPEIHVDMSNIIWRKSN